MNRLCKLVLMSFVFSCVFALESSAQGFNTKNRYWSIGVSLNAMNYVGDLDPGPSFISPGIKFTRYNFGAFVTRRISPRVSFRGALSMGRISGDDYVNSSYSSKDIHRKARNLSFFSNIFEVKGDVVIDLIGHRGRYERRPDFVPYLFAGLAYFHHNPKTKMDGSTYALRDFATEGQGTGIAGTSDRKYNLHQIALPIGIGLRYKLSKNLDLAFEIGWRFTTTDYLDDVGGKYVDKNELYNAMGGGDRGLTAVQLSDRSFEIIEQKGDMNLISGLSNSVYVENVGGTNISSFNGYGTSADYRGDRKGRRDAYIVTGFHLSYIIPKRVVCPKFR
jgi:hypothetical protein